MRKFESNVQYTKYLVNREITERFIKGENLQNSLDEIAETIIPGPEPMTRCCIYKERHIIKERAKFAVEPLENENVIHILRSACDECPVDRYVVTEACRGCLAHKCQEVCPKNAIMIAGQRAYINQKLCIECGKCKEACPFTAISDVQRPCLRSCSAGAIVIDVDKKAYIDEDKCVSCGACVYQCPFGAIVDKSFVVDTLELIKNSEGNTKYKVYAIVAPAIGSQYTNVKIEQVINGIERLGFYHAIEVALGADIVACHEAKEFSETIGERAWMTTSCCPAFVKYIQRNYPEMMSHVSSTVSPMIAIAQVIRSLDENCKIVFIGPCTAKKMEINEDDIKGIVDVVITFEELQAMLDAYGIDLSQCSETSLDNASYYGRLFARSGGVTEAVKQAMDVLGLEADFQPVKCDGLDEVAKTMKVASFGKLKGNFIEGMACKCGCIGGAASLSHGAKDVTEVDKYGKLSKEENSVQATRIFDVENIELERKYNIE
ncbi:MAG: 4Fe-4S binding protein [Firmicutes bacterium]|nr:4Fe-4S binding protein [Bacillota bacterium]